MKKALMLVVASLLVAPAAYALDISLVTTVDEFCYPVYFGLQVSIEGLAMCSDELGSAGPAYIEDATGGVAFYFWPIADYMATGDIVQITAYVDFYNGLIELADDPVTGDPPTVTVISSGNTVTPHVITIPEIGETIQGSLVKIEDVMFPEADCVTMFTYTHEFVDADGNVGVMYTDSSTDLNVNVIPSGWVSITGPLGKYTPGPDFCEGYQVLPLGIVGIEGGEPTATDLDTWSGVKAMYR